MPETEDVVNHIHEFAAIDEDAIVTVLPVVVLETEKAVTLLVVGVVLFKLLDNENTALGLIPVTTAVILAIVKALPVKNIVKFSLAVGSTTVTDLITAAVDCNSASVA